MTTSWNLPTHQKQTHHNYYLLHIVREARPCAIWHFRWKLPFVDGFLGLMELESLIRFLTALLLGPKIINLCSADGSTPIVELNSYFESFFATTSSTTLEEWEVNLPTEQEQEEMRAVSCVVCWHESKSAMCLILILAALGDLSHGQFWERAQSYCGQLQFIERLCQHNFCAGNMPFIVEV